MLVFIGDTHGEWGKLNTILNELYQKNKTDLNVIITGDFGFWPFINEFNLSKIKIRSNIKIFFCPGNHENWFELEKIEKENPNKKIIEIHKNIFYCTFGAILEIENKKIMFCGGAESIDKNHRTIGYDWFPNEIISYGDMLKLDQEIKTVDIIVSHTCPDFIFKQMKFKTFFNKNSDPSCKYLTQIFQMYTPKLWFFGHFHFYQKILTNQTTFICLSSTDGLTQCVYKL